MFRLVGACPESTRVGARPESTRVGACRESTRVGACPESTLAVATAPFPGVRSPGGVPSFPRFGICFNSIQFWSD